MRISDWSSDVCSSDLQRRIVRHHVGRGEALGEFLGDEAGGEVAGGEARMRHDRGEEGNIVRNAADIEDRKSDVEGKSVSVSVDLGGRRIIKKNKNKQ